MVLGVQLVDALTLRSAGHGRPSRATISFHAALRRSVFADRPDFELRVGVSPCLLYRGTNASFLPVLSSETKWEVAFYGPPFYPSGHTTSAYELRFENFVNPVPGGRIGRRDHGTWIRCSRHGERPRSSKHSVPQRVLHAREIPIQRTVSHMVLWSRVRVRP